MQLILGWLVKKFGVSIVVTAISVLYFAIVIAFYAFMINALITVYHIIQTLIDYIGNGPASLVASTSSFSLFGLFSAMGISQAFNDSMPLIASALVFVITKKLYSATKSAYKDIVSQATRAANLYV
jgi:hypothetical protein